MTDEQSETTTTMLLDLEALYRLGVFPLERSEQHNIQRILVSSLGANAEGAGLTWAELPYYCRENEHFMRGYEWSRSKQTLVKPEAT